MKKRIAAMVLAGAMALSLVPAYGVTEVKAEAGDMKIAMVTDSGDITDQSFNQTTYEACKAWSEENGSEFNYYKPESDSDEARNASVDQAVADGANVIVLPGYMFAATFFVIYSEIFFTKPSFCSADLDTFSGRSGQSITPFRRSRNSGITSLMLSAINTWLLYSLIVPSMESYSVLIFGKYRIPFRLNG